MTLDFNHHVNRHGSTSNPVSSDYSIVSPTHPNTGTFPATIETRQRTCKPSKAC